MQESRPVQTVASVEMDSASVETNSESSTETRPATRILTGAMARIGGNLATPTLSTASAVRRAREEAAARRAAAPLAARHGKMPQKPASTNKRVWETGNLPPSVRIKHQQLYTRSAAVRHVHSLEMLQAPALPSAEPWMDALWNKLRGLWLACPVCLGCTGQVFHHTGQCDRVPGRCLRCRGLCPGEQGHPLEECKLPFPKVPDGTCFHCWTSTSGRGHEQAVAEGEAAQLKRHDCCPSGFIMLFALSRRLCETGWDGEASTLEHQSLKDVQAAWRDIRAVHDERGILRGAKMLLDLHVCAAVAVGRT